MTKIADYLESHPDIAPDFTIDQHHGAYTTEENAVWRHLYRRQAEVLKGRACDEFLEGLKCLDLGDDTIPDFRRLSDALSRLTGWQVVAVPGLVPDDIFFEHLANRRFPAGSFIRRPEQIDYLEEPDVFHDVFGHVPMLANPVFADYLEAYGKGGLRAIGFHALEKLARLYWYTVEFGLIDTPIGRRIYGSGIVSSKAESIFCLEDPSPNHIHFNLLRIMRTRYRIDDYQQTYFVIDSFEELFMATAETDFAPVYATLEAQPDLDAADTLPEDKVYQHGTQDYARAKAGRT